MKYTQKDIEKLGYAVIDSASELNEDNTVTTVVSLVEFTDGDGDKYLITIKAKRAQ